MELSPPPSPEALSWVSEQCGGLPVAAVEVLRGGRSHANDAITLGEPGGRRVVLRRWVRPDWRERDPDFTVEREVAALVLLERAGFAAPQLLAADPQGDRGGTPALLMTLLPGRAPDQDTAASTWSLEQLATAAVALHRTPRPWPGIPAYRPYNQPHEVRPPRGSTRSDLWEQAITLVAGAQPTYREVFIHRDYHPGNTLWLDQRLTGVVDWTTASIGPAGVDLGHMRWNLVLDHGEEAADECLGRYYTQCDGAYEHHAYWDLRTLVDLLPAADLTETQLARLETYLAGILGRC
jgi:aminoglycoside phosphotransferase (APT) family kinase protein